MGAAPRVVVYGRPGCHLCEVAEDVVARVCRAAGARWEVISVADDPQLLALYGELIPVVTVDGRQVAVYRVEEAELSACLLYTSPSPRD